MQAHFYGSESSANRSIPALHKDSQLTKIKWKFSCKSQKGQLLVSRWSSCLSLLHEVRARFKIHHCMSPLRFATIPVYVPEKKSSLFRSKIKFHSLFNEICITSLLCYVCKIIMLHLSPIMFDKRNEQNTQYLSSIR